MRDSTFRAGCCRIRLQLGLILFLGMQGLGPGIAEAVEVNIDAGWVMRTGDDSGWAAPEQEDTAWQAVSVGVPWEEAGFPDHDGVAWYRVKFVVPADWQSLSEVKVAGGSLVVSLGPIDDVDMTYVNGVKVGQTGRMPPDYATAYDQDRTYHIPAAVLHWGGTNVLAVRVFDGEGPGGITRGPVVIRPPTPGDYLDLVLRPTSSDGIYAPSSPVSLSCVITSRADRALPHIFMLEATLQDDRVVDPAMHGRIRTLVDVFARTGHEAPLIFHPPAPGFYRVVVTLKHGQSLLTTRSVVIGYAPEDLPAAPTREPDFQAFWRLRAEELAAVRPAFNMTRSELSTDRLSVYLVEMRSHGNLRIRGWYTVPRTPGPHPAVLRVPGYTGTMEPALEETGLAVLALNPRGHGNSREDLDPGDGEYMYLGLDPDHPEQYVYVGAYLDCVRAVDFLASRPEIDPARIGVTGGSQGGGLAFATAALDARIAFCAPDIPWLGDWPGYMACAPWALEEFPKLLAARPELDPAALQRILSYVDTMNLAADIRCPVLMSVGLQDEVCPPRTAFAAYNQVSAEKTYRVYPSQGHTVPERHNTLRRRWILEKVR